MQNPLDDSKPAPIIDAQIETSDRSPQVSQNASLPNSPVISGAVAPARGIQALRNHTVTPVRKVGKREQPITDALIEGLKETVQAPDGKMWTRAQLLARRLILQASDPKAGKAGFEALLTIIERTEGRVPVRSELTGLDGGPVQVDQHTVTNRAEAVALLTDVLSRIRERAQSIDGALGSKPEPEKPHAVLEDGRFRF